MHYSQYMHYSQREKYEIIRLVEQSDLGVIRTLKQLKVNKTTFYKWYKIYLEKGYDGLKRKQTERKYSVLRQVDPMVRKTSVGQTRQTITYAANPTNKFRPYLIACPRQDD